VTLWLFAFGTITDMTFGQYNSPKLRIIFWILSALLIVSCASSPDPMPETVTQSMPAIATLTPFQPQPGNSSLEPMTPQIEPTYTPYPTKYVVVENLPTPVLVAPMPDGGEPDSSLLNTNNPLTGLPVSDPSLLERRPIAIKISKYPRTVPQHGVSLADIVFEYYIEWGDSRFIAIFYGNDAKQVGAVRSGRYFDEHVTRMYHSYYVYNFADPRELTYFKNSDLSDFLVNPGALGSSCPPFFVKRVDIQIADASHYETYFDTTKFSACLARKGLDNTIQIISGGFFSDSPPTSTLAVKRIYTRYSAHNYNYWDYDAATRKYFRYDEPHGTTDNTPEAYAPLTDAETGLPVTADNVVVLFVPYIFANQYDAHDEVYHIDLLASGSAYVFRDGVATPAIWNRTDEDQPLLLTTLTGDPIYLRPGRTFYEVMGVNSTYTQDGTDWHFVFQTP
jgi:hypothetical protein